MAITKEALRVRTGQSLTDFQNQAQGAINVLNGIKTNLLSLRTVVTNDTANFTADDVTEINTILTNLATQIQAILA